MLNKRADKLELLRIAEAVALEKAIDKELIISSMETGIAKAAKSKFGQDNEIKVAINRDNGDIEIFRKLTISEKPENSNTEIKLEDAINLNETNKDKSVGDEVLQPLPAFDFGRIAAQTAKQVISFNVREAERERQYNDFIDKKDSILSGIVKRLEFGNVIVDLGRTEAIIQKNELIPRENIKAGDRIKAYCYDVRREPRGQQIFLSRAHPKFMEKLFIQEVPEIYDGLIEIKSSSRDPGSRAKICVKAVDTSLDPVGACVGMRGSRVQSVSNEIAGERIDIILWDENPAQFVINAMSPAAVLSIVMDEDSKSMDIAVEEEKLSQAIGRGGQNVKLASQLTGWDLNVMTEGQVDEKSEVETKTISDNFVKHLDIKPEIALILAQEGFSSVDEIAYAPPKDMSAIEAFDESIVEEIRNKARDYLLKQAINPESLNMDAEPSKALLEMEGMTNDLAFELACRGIITIDDLADQSIDELMPISNMTEEVAGKLIMTARAPMFEGKNNK